MFNMETLNSIHTHEYTYLHYNVKIWKALTLMLFFLFILFGVGGLSFKYKTYITYY